MPKRFEINHNTDHLLYWFICSSTDSSSAENACKCFRAIRVLLTICTCISSQQLLFGRFVQFSKSFISRSENGVMPIILKGLQQVSRFQNYENRTIYDVLHETIKRFREIHWDKLLPFLRLLNLLLSLSNSLILWAAGATTPSTTWTIPFLAKLSGLDILAQLTVTILSLWLVG